MPFLWGQECEKIQGQVLSPVWGGCTGNSVSSLWRRAFVITRKSCSSQFSQVSDEDSGNGREPQIRSRQTAGCQW